MRSKITAFGARLLIWNFSKIFRSGIQSLFVDMSGVSRINKLVAEGKRVILLPMYQSYADFFVLFYVQNKVGLPQNFCLAGIDDIPKIKLFKTWVRNCGCILSKKAKD